MSELRQAEDQAKKAMSDAARLAEELRQEQEHASQIEKLRRALDGQVKELQVRVDEAEAAALHGGRKTIQALEQRVRRSTVVLFIRPKCQDTNGRMNERTDAGNRIRCILALKIIATRCQSGGNNFNDFPDNQLTKFRVFIG